MTSVYKNIYYCPNCCNSIDTPLPVEPVYTVKMAAMLIPCVSDANLRSMLYLNKHNLSEPQYRIDNHGRRHRMIPASDIRYLRNKTVTKGYSRASRGLPARLPSEDYHALKNQYMQERIKLENGRYEKFKDYWQRTRPQDFEDMNDVRG
jgi:hypothetical protein